MVPVHHTTLPTALGDLTIVCSSAGVVATIFDDEERDPELARIEHRFVAGRRSDADEARTLARTAHSEAQGYLSGSTRSFTVPPDLTLVGSGFARRVLEVVATIPFGELWTYGDVAGMAGNPRAARAAGSALARCPIELFVPCHRVVHSGGTIGGYGRHEARKRWLLRHERAIP
ncbi:MAG TPA: methylated-DNA--[protein]-cysteine S-methyltransferase [Actinomycetota bacterium]|nr:methylated-DNA--[protein]-cysteine S-methyltransferase [Actinomycetota bacterium]